MGGLNKQKKSRGALYAIDNFLDIKENCVDVKTLAALIFGAWLFSFACRLIWTALYLDVAEFYWLGEFMINTPDGYFWAEGARDLIENPAYIDELSPVTRSLPIITAFLAKYLPFIPFETLIFYLPAALGSLLVVPIVLIGHSLKQSYMGFGAALIGSIAWSYYNRTMVGYYDDDMLIIVLSTLSLYSIVAGVTSKKSIFLLLAAIFAPLSIWYYPNSQLLIFGMAGVLFIYSLLSYQSDEDGDHSYNDKLLFFLFTGILSMRFGIAIGSFIIVALFALFVIFEEQTKKRWLILPLLIFAAIVSLYFSGVIASFWHQFSGYIVRRATSVSADTNATLHFYNVAQTVREAQEIPFSEFASRISGHTLAFIVALIGTIALMSRYRVMLISLPFIGLGFMAYGIPGLINGGGLRFTIFAVAVMALGLSYLLFCIADRISFKIVVVANLIPIKLKNVFLALSFVVFLSPHILHIFEYSMQPPFDSNEVQILNEFKKRTEARKDYVITWWDYGYPLRYYTYLKTLADGGKHSGADNFAPSFILSTPNQISAANLSRLAVEYTERQFAERSYASIIAQMMQDYGETTARNFLKRLGDSNLTLPDKTRETYLFLPDEMSYIYSTVMQFSSLEPDTGKEYDPPFFIGARISGANDGVYQLYSVQERFTIDAKRGIAVIRGREVPISRYFETGYVKENETVRFARSGRGFNRDGVVVIINFALGTGWLMSELAFNSTYVQLFALENYDPTLFEPVIMSPRIKIYRVLK
ncbi:MAG: peptide transporter [Helicobacteraceae bacterium]|jgi:dolichyl-diphosphooligosaccharide--protein glycosyltransferase/undecaprenyl-diphosphooligosaccharide--protein glycosyltransferase|nr:peptide transporter [Helicobacteraceae bacterium]